MDKKTLNKAEAAEHIGVSVRTLLRLTGKEIAHMPKRRQSDETLYDRAELDAYLEREQATPQVSATVTPGTDGAPVTPKSPVNTGVSRLPSMTVTPDTDERLLMMAALMAQEMMQRMPAMLPPAPNGHEASITDLAHKLVLSLAEASQLSGLSKSMLREAIEEGTLKGRIIGRGFKVKRADLDAYVKRL